MFFLLPIFLLLFALVWVILGALCGALVALLQNLGIKKKSSKRHYF